MLCPDCKGSGVYIGFNVTIEPCAKCKGMGTVGEPGSLCDLAGSAPNDEYFETIDRIKKAIDDFDKEPVGIYPDTEIDMGISPIIPLLPLIQIGTLIHVFDAGWYEGEVTKIEVAPGPGMGNTIYTAEYSYGSFTIPRVMLSYNTTHSRWEYIRSGTPVW